MYKINIPLHILAINILITLTMHPKIEGYLIPRRPRMSLPHFRPYPNPNPNPQFPKPKKPISKNPFAPRTPVPPGYTAAACRAHLALLTRACSSTPNPPVMQLTETPVPPPVPAPVMAPAPSPSEGAESVPGSNPAGGHNPTSGHIPTGGQFPTGGRHPTGGQFPTGGRHPTGGHHPFGGHHQQGGHPSTEYGSIPATPEGECCRLLTAVENACVCSVLSHLPVFLSKPTHHFTVTVGDMCQVTFGCVSKKIVDD